VAEKRRSGSLLGWPLALGAGCSGFVVWLLQTVTGAALGTLEAPNREASFGAAFGFFLHAGAYALPVVLAVLFLSLVAGAALSGIVLFGPQPFEAVLRRLHELGAAIPPLLLLMLWRIAEPNPSRIGFIAALSCVFAVEIAQLLAETGRRLERTYDDRGEAVGARWQRFLTNSVVELRSQLATQAALVAGAVFALDAALSFIGLGVRGMPTWGSLIGAAAQLGNVAPSAVVLALGGCFATVIGAYRLLSIQSNDTGQPAAGAD
jgi:ABC-type dipeptide/oligopeptide/nickel transport system permease subunit